MENAFIESFRVYLRSFGNWQMLKSSIKLTFYLSEENYFIPFIQTLSVITFVSLDLWTDLKADAEGEGEGGQDHGPGDGSQDPPAEADTIVSVVSWNKILIIWYQFISADSWFRLKCSDCIYIQNFS